MVGDGRVSYSIDPYVVTEYFAICHREEWTKKQLAPPELVVNITLHGREMDEFLWLGDFDEPDVEEGDVLTTAISHLDVKESVFTTTYIYS